MLECSNSNAWFSKVFHVRLQVWNTRTPHVNTNQSGLKDCADLAMPMRGTPLILIILASRQKTGVIRTLYTTKNAIKNGCWRISTSIVPTFTNAVLER